ncbi:YidH family protein [Microbacterium sulfonylureivorans]|uniref:YidH family protein n=1 Tax=Microbacterium sulfonylureivorans TaxID=2486854 RepID=UPI000FD7953F|nr:DUF202 domain-containing protein [Microbacterium sulfonylureivorans]
MTRPRFPRSVYEIGTDPDPRFSLANERTFLAWTRTALALLAGGVVLEGFELGLNEALRLAASITLIVAGIVIPMLSWFEWMAAERALRLARPLPGARTSAVLAVVVIVVGVLVLLGVLVP